MIRRTVVLAAAHKGSYLALAPLEDALSRSTCVWCLNGTAASTRRGLGLTVTPPPSRPEAWLRALNPAALVRGTSEIPAARNHEARLAEAAVRLGIPVFAIEDFPGNYGDDPSAPSLLFVEHASSRLHHIARGHDHRRVRAVGALRRPGRAPRLTRAAARRRYGLARDARVVLWAGQPDARACAGTLRALSGVLDSETDAILYRAHPRARAVPPPFFKHARVVDVSREPDATSAVRASDAVLTQFSSLAVEAGALGVPGIFVLLPKWGRRYLRARTGLDDLPWPQAGAAFAVRRAAEARAVIRRAIGDRHARARALRRWRALSRRGAGAAAAVAAVIERIRS